MKMTDTVRRNLGPWTGQAIVLGMFVGVPVAIWWVASPMIQTLPMDQSYRSLMSTMVLASVVFGLTSAFMVWRDLANEP